MPMQAYNPDGVHAPTFYSHAVEIGPSSRILYVSGQIGVGRDGVLVEGFDEQTEQAIRNLAAVLRQAGMAPTDVIKLTTFLVRREDLDSFRIIRERFCGHHRPASTVLFVSSLAREDALIEIEAVAAKP